MQARQQVYDLLCAMPKQGLAAAKELFWHELNYDRAAEPLSYRNWPERARQALAEPPLLLARYEAGLGPFEVIYGRLATTRRSVVSRGSSRARSRPAGPSGSIPYR